MTECVIVSAARTPIGALGGCYKDISAAKLGSVAIQGALKRAGIDASLIDEVLMGCVLQAGQGQAPARQAAILAGLSNHVPCTTINKMCGSGMKSVMLAHDEIIAGTCEALIAGGMENMSQAPYLIPGARFGYRFGHATLIDHMLIDGLEDAYERGLSMGVFAERCVDKYEFTREMLDEFALRSLTRAQTAILDGSFTAEIEPVDAITSDETPTKAKPEKIPLLKPAFKKDGKVTAANSSSISDGAAALIIMSAEKAKKLKLKPLAVIRAHASFAHEPAWFTTAPIEAIRRVLHKANWNQSQVDLFEINEAFAVVALAAMHDLKLAVDQVNIHGGACALGHPIGASGARVLVTLLHALKKKKLKKGIAALCIGGGEATAVAVEMLQ